MSFLDNVLSGIARELKTLSGVVDVSQSPAPVPGQVLTAIDATHAHWADPTGGGGGGGGYIIADALNTGSGDPAFAVDVSGSPIPSPGQVLLAVGTDAATWSDPPWLSLDEFTTANTVLCALDGDGGLGPVAVVMPPSTALMRADTGDIFAGTGADLAALIGPVSGTDSTARAAAAAAQATADAAVPKALFDANTVLVADVDNTPHALAAPASSVMTRLATGAIKWGSVAELQALLAISVSGGGAITQFAWASNAATLSLLTSKNWAASVMMGANCTITITNGVEGDYGTIYVRQDGPGAHTITFTVTGRTLLRDANAIDDNPQSFNGTMTAYNYHFVTITGQTYCRLTKVFLSL
jgi:hypothetical protein